MAGWAPRGHLETQALRESLDRLAPRDWMVVMVSRVLLVLWGQQGRREPRGFKAYREYKDRMGLLVRMALMGLMGLLGQWEQRGLLAPKGYRASRVYKV